jgi:hypothetical protein
MIDDQSTKSDHSVLVDILKAFRLTVIGDIRSACKHRPGYICKLATDERIILRRCGAERDVGLTFRQIEYAVHHKELDAQPGITLMEDVE